MILGVLRIEEELILKAPLWDMHKDNLAWPLGIVIGSPVVPDPSFSAPLLLLCSPLHNGIL